MSRHFPGVLKNPSEPGSGLRVTLVLSSDIVEIESNGVSLGIWTCKEIDAARSDGNWFSIHVDNEEWQFLPDAPTEFLFYAVPHLGQKGSRRRGRKPRFQVNAPDIVSLSRVALGAVLAVFLLSIGMLMGRYQWDNSSLTGLLVLIATAALGAWWTIIQRQDRQETGATRRHRALVLQQDRKRSALSVREVLSMAQMDETEETTRTEAKPGMIISATDGGSSQVGGDSDALEGPISPDMTGIDRDDTGAGERNDFREDPQSDRDIENKDSGAAGEEEHLASITDDAEPFDAEPTHTELNVASTDPLTTSSEGEAWDDHESVVHGPRMWDDVRSDIEPDNDQRTDSFASMIPEPSLLSSDDDGGKSPEVDDEKETTENPLTSTRALSISVAEILDETADLVEPTRLIKQPPDAAGHASPIDLTAIRGIGPAISAALIHLGVADVQHLAMLDSDDQAYLERRLGRFASRSRAIRWVDDAQRLVSEDPPQSV